MLNFLNFVLNFIFITAAIVAMGLCFAILWAFHALSLVLLLCEGVILRAFFKIRRAARL